MEERNYVSSKRSDKRDSCLIEESKQGKGQKEGCVYFGICVRLVFKKIIGHGDVKEEKAQEEAEEEKLLK